jgi:hypothetical protein
LRPALVGVVDYHLDISPWGPHLLELAFGDFEGLHPGGNRRRCSGVSWLSGCRHRRLGRRLGAEVVELAAGDVEGFGEKVAVKLQ